MPLLSIIIPVYNTEDYLESCLNSILSQSMDDFEVLLIDDGSSDKSGRICNYYAGKDKRLKVFHKTNGGVSSARNIGIDNATGEWALFVDSDDLLFNDALAHLTKCIEYDIDHALGGYRKFDESNDNIETVSFEKSGYFSVEEAIDNFIALFYSTGDWQKYLWNRLFRLSIINSYNLRFRTDLSYKEDGLFVIQYLSKCTKKIMYIPDLIYLYRQGANSAMSSLYKSFNPLIFSNIDSHGEIYKTISNLEISKSIKIRELNHLFGNYYWIRGILKSTGSYNRDNKKELTARLIKNGGFFNYIFFIYFFRYFISIKRRLSLD